MHSRLQLPTLPSCGTRQISGGEFTPSEAERSSPLLSGETVDVVVVALVVVAFADVDTGVVGRI